MGYKTVEVREIAIQHRVNGAAIAAAVVVLREILGLAACLWEQQLKFNPYLCFHCWLKKPFLDFHRPKGDTRKNILEMDRYIILLISWVFKLVKISNAIKIQIYNRPSRNAIFGHLAIELEKLLWYVLKSQFHVPTNICFFFWTNWVWHNISKWTKVFL